MKIAVFIDYQNIYRGARRAFFPPPSSPSHWDGQIDPAKVGAELIAREQKSNANATLEVVRIYRGLPDGGKDPRGYAACSKQVAKWRTLPKVEAVTRPLRYPQNYPAEKPTEKGIDVQLAIDFVMLAHSKRYDRGIIFSADTDLRPALEAVMTMGPGRVATAAWKPNGGPAYRLNVPGAVVYCHFFDDATYRRVADPTDYNL